jgi:hypothetical protein
VENRTLWTFGDSFTESVLDNPTYVEFLQGNKHENWTEKLSKYLDYNLQNFGKGGMSPQTIIDTFIENMNDFKENDIVVISTSPYIRIIGYDNHFDKITTWNSESFYLYYIKDKIHALNKTDDFNFGTPFDDEKRIHLMVDYIDNFIVPYENKWKEYFENKISKFIDLFNQRNIKIFYWDYYLWKSNTFTNLNTETKGIIKDTHWGIEGETQFLQYIIDRIEKRNQFHSLKSPNYKI